MIISMSIFVYVLFTVLIFSRFSYFPDFDNYDMYIDTGKFRERFHLEPMSSVLMGLSSDYDLGAQGYYSLTWVVSSIIVFLVPFFFGKRYFILSVFFLVNPVSMILLQTPRQFLSYSIFILSFFVLSKFKVLLLLVFAFFAHNISGVLSFYYVFLFRCSKFFFVLSFVFGFFAFFWIVEMRYSYYLVDDGIQRGVGRFLYVTSFLLLFWFLSFCQGKSSFYLMRIVLSFLFLIFVYFYTEYGGRFLPYFVVFSWFFYFDLKASLFHFRILISYIFLSFLVVFLIVFIGGFGYG